jgi:hypothetical protein
MNERTSLLAKSALDQSYENPIDRNLSDEPDQFGAPLSIALLLIDKFRVRVPTGVRRNLASAGCGALLARFAAHRLN